MSDEYGSYGGLLAALDQLQVCRELLLAGTPVKARMAVILLDALADGLLFRRFQRMIESSEEQPWFDPARYPKSVRRQVERSYPHRLRLATEEFPDVFTRGDPLLTEADETVLRVGHAYRNAAYHRDKHNPAVVSAIGKTMFCVVAAMLVRAQPESWASQSGSVEARLRDFGLKPPRRIPTMRAIGEQAASGLLLGLEISDTELAHQLAADLERRADDAELLASELPITATDLNHLLAWAEFWDKHGASDELVELNDQRNPMLAVARSNGRTDAEVLAALAEAELQFRAHVSDLRRKAGPATINMELLERARGAARSIRKAMRATALSYYYDADTPVALLERYLDEATEAYERHVQLEIDIARGK